MSHNLIKSAILLIAIFHLAQAWQFVCFKGTRNNNQTESYQNASRFISSGIVDVLRNTTIFMPGFLQRISRPGVVVLLDALLAVGKNNVCAVDGSELSNPIYPLAVEQVDPIASEVAQGIKNMVDAGLDPNKLEPTGMSLGAHMAGGVGRHFFNITGKKLPVIFALEPAKPEYEGIKIAQPVTKADADFVACFHTDYHNYGINTRDCHVDMVINACTYDSTGRQPGCPPCYPIVCLPFSDTNLCSHKRAMDLWTEGISTPGTMPATKAENKDAWIASGGTPNEVIYMDQSMNRTARGVYFFRTAGQSLYGLGDAGIILDC